jgi:hypothetical protein
MAGVPPKVTPTTLTWLRVQRRGIEHIPALVLGLAVAQSVLPVIGHAAIARGVARADRGAVRRADPADRGLARACAAEYRRGGRRSSAGWR